MQTLHDRTEVTGEWEIGGVPLAFLMYLHDIFVL